MTNFLPGVIMTIGLLMRYSMRLDVSKALASEGNEIPFASEIWLSDIFMFGEVIHFQTPAKLAGTCQSVGKTVKIRGELSFVAQARCSLCLKPIESPFTIPAEAEYALSEDALSAENRNPDVYFYDGAWIDPSQMAADAVRLALPIQWRCSANCKGLCPVCGADKNRQECACVTDNDNLPFAKLSWNDDK